MDSTCKSASAATAAAGPHPAARAHVAAGEFQIEVLNVDAAVLAKLELDARGQGPDFADRHVAGDALTRRHGQRHQLDEVDRAGEVGEPGLFAGHA